MVTFGPSAAPSELLSHAHHNHKIHKMHKNGLGLKHNDLALLEDAMHQQAKEKHRACIKECEDSACRHKCHTALSLHTESAHQAHKSAGLHLKKADLKLLQDAQKARHEDEVKHCEKCITSECKANCKQTLRSLKDTHAAVKHHVNLGLKAGDMALLKDAQKRQAKEEAKHMYMQNIDRKALKTTSSSLHAIDEVNHQPGDDGNGDWAPGMRSSAMQQLKQEQREAAKTAQFAYNTDNDDSWSN
uniref:Uncharacterized protein n=1 Tax=Hanusia phi TaxID=3032 RepID=A0A7S0EYV4_9CRYP